MPEGDTLHRVAKTLQAALAGKQVTRFETVLPALDRVDDQTPLRGRTIERVHAIGKHLLIEFSGGLTLRSHLRMNGTWHIYRAGERWMRPRSDMRLAIATEDFVAVGFNVPVAELLDERARVRSEELRRLGQDLLGEQFDLAEARERVRAHGGQEIGNVLLNQRVVAGIGNVYKSELLFIRRLNPFRRVDELTNDEVDSLLTTARKLLRHNVERESGRRETRTSMRGEDRLYVYGRAGKPCRRCGTAIEMRKQGPDARVTFWCGKCQK
jgi:endonuclease-8